MTGYLQSESLPFLQGMCCRLFCIASSRSIFGDTVSAGCPVEAGAAAGLAGGVALVCAAAVVATAAASVAAAIR